MKYYVCEGKPNGKYNASSKARDDVEKILQKNKVEQKFVDTKNYVQEKKIMKWKQPLIYINNKKKWLKFCENLRENDIVFIQYPILNITYNLDKIISKFKRKGIIFVAIIHDLDSLRCNAKNNGKFTYKRICKDDKCILNSVNYIIAHNDSMKKELIKLGNNENKIITLKLFDYLIDRDLKKIEHKKNEPIIIAGNLSAKKAQYLSGLKKIKNVKFNLYGVGFTDEVAGKNITYKGKYLPEELLDHLEGSFGLVWDGISTKTCEGGFGEYLKYNNPHKVSLYLTAGIPVIVWKKSALAEFVTKNNVGITIDNLEKLSEELNKITGNQYSTMLENAKKISKKTTSGNYLTQAINSVIKKIG